MSGSGAARTFVAGLSGVVFGLGLAISGMINPKKVIGFLDVAGDWDPTLAFVMGGALLVAVPAFRLAARRQKPLLEDGFDLPTRKTLDARLIGGSALFGTGWGLVGFCPGPAVAALGPAVVAGPTPVLVFVAAMLAGMFFYEATFGRRDG